MEKSVFGKFLSGNLLLGVIQLRSCGDKYVHLNDKKYGLHGFLPISCTYATVDICHSSGESIS